MAEQFNNNQGFLEKDYYQLFEDVYHQYKELYFRYILKFVCDYHTAEELLQEVFLKIAANLQNLKDRTKAKSWGFQITVNACRQWYRKKKKEKLSFVPHLDVLPQTVIVREEKDNSSQEGLSVIREIIQDLSCDERNIFIMKYWEKQSYHEIAEVLHMSQRTVRRRLKKAVSRIIQVLKKKNVLSGKYYNFKEDGL